MKQPEKSDYAEYYNHYVELAKTDDVIQTLEKQIAEIQTLFSEITEDKANFAYANKKWTVKEVLGHIIDTERIMAYRALRIARADKTNLPGFEQDDYVKEGNYSQRDLSDLVNEFKTLRESNLAMFMSFNEEVLRRQGIASNTPVSVTALVYIIAGHAIHHLKVLKEKYLH